jgi:hypothetical protein
LFPARCLVAFRVDSFEFFLWLLPVDSGFFLLSPALDVFEVFFMLHILK